MLIPGPRRRLFFFSGFELICIRIWAASFRGPHGPSVPTVTSEPRVRSSVNGNRFQSNARKDARREMRRQGEGKKTTRKAKKLGELARRLIFPCHTNNGSKNGPPPTKP